MTTLDTAPAEVLHAICDFLSPGDVAALRMTSKVLSEVGAYYLVRRVTFHTSQASLDRLQQIADHQGFRQHVETLQFEANLLAVTCCRECWQERFTKPSHGTRSLKLEKPKTLQPPVTVRQRREYARDLRKWEQNVNDAYDDHQKLREIQQNILRKGPDLMAQILPQFPRVQNIIFTIGKCQHMLSKQYQNEFNSKLGFCAPLSHDTAPTGPQLKHLILPGGKPLPNLQALVVSDLDPSFFALPNGAPTLRHAFTKLKKLDITFRLPDKIEAITEPGPYRDLQDGGLRDAICMADDLEDLHINFIDYSYDGICVDLCNILGKKSFDRLKKLQLSYFEASGKSFVETLRRQKKLKHLALSTVSIKGCWVDIIDRMRRELSLKEATFDGFLSDDNGMYDMENAEIQHFMECHEEFSIGAAISMHVLKECIDGSNPLETFMEDYADRDTLHELHAEMMAELDEECECDHCSAVRELEAGDPENLSGIDEREDIEDANDSATSDGSDDGMPGREDSDDLDGALRVLAGGEAFEASDESEAEAESNDSDDSNDSNDFDNSEDPEDSGAMLESMPDPAEMISLDDEFGQLDDADDLD